MNVEDITFGVEIETTVPRGTLNVGPHGMGCDIPQLPGWKADGDPSIRTTAGTSDHQGCEFVSPVFKGSEGLRQCLADLAVIKGFGAKVNPSCGLHIHVGFDKDNPELVAKLTTLVANFEKAIFASTGTKRRETSRWCNGLQRYGTVEAAQRQNNYSRYHVANFATSKPTVEFRAFAATLDATKLAGYVALCVGLVERAVRAKKETKWAAKPPVPTSPFHRNGEGQTALCRLFYQLGWTKGDQPHVHGNLNGEGIPPLPRIKKEFVRLAKKYDTPPVVRTATAGVPTTFPVGTRVRVECPGSAVNGQVGVIEVRRARRSPVVRFDSGRAYRIRLNMLRVIAG